MRSDNAPYSLSGGERAIPADYSLGLFLLFISNPSRIPAVSSFGVSAVLACLTLLLSIVLRDKKGRADVRPSGIRGAVLPGLFLVYLVLMIVTAPNDRVPDSVAVAQYSLVLVLAIVVFVRFAFDSVLIGLSLVGPYICFLSLCLAPFGLLQLSPFEGVYGHKNIAGFVLCTSAMAAFHRLVNQEWKQGWAVLTLSSVGLILTQSMTGVAVLLLFVLLELGVRRLVLVPRAQIGTGSLFAVLGCLFFVGIWAWHQRAAIFPLFGRSVTASARTQIWAEVIRYWQESRWIGYGFANVWGESDYLGQTIRAELFNPAATHAHSGYLDVLIQTGLIGLGIIALLIVRLFWCLARSDTVRFGVDLRFVLSFIVSFLVYNVFEPRVFHFLGWFLVCYCSMVASDMRVRSV